MSITDKQARFVEEYLLDLNATQAAIRAGYSVVTAQEQSSRLLSNVMVADAIAEAQELRSKRTAITADDVLRELVRIGFADIRNVVQWKGNVTQVSEDEDTGEQVLSVTNQVALIDSELLSPDVASTIAEISQSEKGAMKIKLHDKLGALNKIGLHLGMFKQRVEHTGKDGGAIETMQLLPSRDRMRSAFALLTAREAEADDDGS